MKKQVVVTLSSVILAAASYAVMPAAKAGWFGPGSYEECVMDRVQKLEKKAAYVMTELRASCRKQFPYTAAELEENKRRDERVRAEFDRLVKQEQQRIQAEEQERQRLQADFDKDVQIYEKCSYDMKNRMGYIPDEVRDANEIERCMYEKKHGIRDPWK